MEAIPLSISRKISSKLQKYLPCLSLCRILWTARPWKNLQAKVQALSSSNRRGSKPRLSNRDRKANREPPMTPPPAPEVSSLGTERFRWSSHQTKTRGTASSKTRTACSSSYRLSVMQRRPSILRYIHQNPPRLLNLVCLSQPISRATRHQHQNSWSQRQIIVSHSCIMPQRRTQTIWAVLWQV